jgi:hypothetical protein
MCSVAFFSLLFDPDAFRATQIHLNSDNGDLIVTALKYAFPDTYSACTDISLKRQGD